MYTNYVLPFSSHLHWKGSHFRWKVWGNIWNEKCRRCSSWNSLSPGCLPLLGGANTESLTDGARERGLKYCQTWYLYMKNPNKHCWHHSSWFYNHNKLVWYVKISLACKNCNTNQDRITSHTERGNKNLCFFNHFYEEQKHHAHTLVYD